MDRRANIAESMGVGVGDGPGLISRQASGTPARWQGVVKAKDAVMIPVDKVQPDPDQPREEFDPEALGRLAESLRARGQLQPIRVRWDEGRGAYVIVCGERRWRAALKAGLPALACVVMEEPIAPEDLLALQLAENCVREDLKPIEQAKAFRVLMERNGWSLRRLADEVSLSHVSVARALALLDLPGDLQGRVESGELAPSVAYEVSRLENPEQQRAVAARVLDEGLNRSEAVAAVRRATGKPAGAKGRGAGKAKEVTARVFRTARAKTTVELRRGSGREAILDALREAVRLLEAELGEANQEAA